MAKSNCEKAKILNIEINNISTSSLLRRIKNGGVLLTPNVDHLMKLQRDREFLEIYRRADYIVCDSKIVYWATKFLGREVEEKISGSDFFPLFYEHYRYDEDIKIFLLGGTEESVELARANINKKIGRQIVVGAYSPPIEFENSVAESNKITELIDKSHATVLAVGVGAPKQEKWIDRHRGKLVNVKIFFAIGATINFEAGNEKRSPKWMSEAGLEWLYRLLQDPQRLWKRYLLDSFPFFLLILLQKFNLYQDNKNNGFFDQKSKIGNYK